MADWALTDDELESDDVTWQFGGVRAEGALRGVRTIFSKRREDDRPVGSLPYEQEAYYRAIVTVLTWANSNDDADVLVAEQQVWKCGEEIRRILKARTMADTLPSDWVAAWVESDIDESNKEMAPALIVSNYVVVIQFQRT